MDPDVSSSSNDDIAQAPEQRPHSGREGRRKEGTKKVERKPDKKPHAKPNRKPAAKPHKQLPKHKASVTIFANTSSVKAKPADRLDVSSEYVQMLQKSYQQSKIAVVVLGLTLAVTGMALTFFVCRIRRIKSRLRRGKALTSDEADYLINGMYL